MRIAFLGDSLTEGRPGAAFFPLLERRLPQHQLLNRGRAGDTVESLRARLGREGLAPVDTAFVWVGANDAVLGSWDSSSPGSGWSHAERLDRLAGTYAELLEWTAARATDIVVVRPLILGAEGSVWEAYADDVAAVVSRVATAASARRVVDLSSAFAAAGAAGRGPFTIDGVHFTNAGAHVVAEAFAGVIVDLEARQHRQNAPGGAAASGDAPASSGAAAGSCGPQTGATPPLNCSTNGRSS